MYQYIKIIMEMEKEEIIQIPKQLIMEEYSIDILNTSQNYYHNGNENNKIKYNFCPAILYYLCAYIPLFFSKKNNI
jgi:hypothetical protein